MAALSSSGVAATATAATQHGMSRVAIDHRITQTTFGIGDGDDHSRTPRNFENNYIPPWRDPVSGQPLIEISPVPPPPTAPPTQLPTGSPTATPIAITASPTTTPIASSLTAVPTAATGMPSHSKVTTAPSLSNKETVYTPAPVFHEVEMMAPEIAEETETIDSEAIGSEITELVESHTTGEVETEITETVEEAEPEMVDPATIEAEVAQADPNALMVSCALLPSIGRYVKQTLDIEYNIYLDDTNGDDTDAIQELVRDYVEPELHENLALLGMGCTTTDFVLNRHTMVKVSSSDVDVVTDTCVVDETTNNATACYTVQGRVEATMWFAPQRRRLRRLQALSTPFGDREAFLQFTQWMEEAVATIEAHRIDDIDYLTGSFQGYVNLRDLDGTVMQSPQNTGFADKATALIDSAYSQNNDQPFNLVYGLVIVVAGTIVLSFVVLFVFVRRKHRSKALREHARCIDELRLDAADDIDGTPDVVDDESLFQEDRPLPSDYRVPMEKANHDYRTCANSSCKLCKAGDGKPQPVFVATDTDKEFLDHLTILKRRNDEEVRELQYESVML